MIATIRRVWPGEVRTTIIATDPDGYEKACFVWVPEQQWIAALCERAERNGGGDKLPVVLTLAQKTRWGYPIEAAELLPTAPEAQP